MIPKVAHYFWFGRNSMPPLMLKCINNWKKYLPDYEIKCWNEDNFDVNKVLYTREAYQAKKWAFVSDYARFYILYQYGGVYLDTDVELVKNIDPLLSNKMFAGFESSTGVNSGLILGSEAKCLLFKEILYTYENECFNLSDGKLNMKTVVKRMTDLLVERGLKLDGSMQVIDEMTIYPVDYFCPIDRDTCRMKLTSNTYSIHHYAGTWLSISDKVRISIIDFLIKLGIYAQLKKIKNWF